MFTHIERPFLQSYDNAMLGNNNINTHDDDDDESINQALTQTIEVSFVSTYAPGVLSV
jgi:hypothetical protein